jgi:hypothetical protein
MKELANHIGPESCVGTREGVRRSVDRGEVGPVLSCETFVFQEADPLVSAGRQHVRRRYRQASYALLRGPRPGACSNRPSHGTRESQELTHQWRRVRVGNPKGTRQR